MTPLIFEFHFVTTPLYSPQIFVDFLGILTQKINMILFNTKCRKSTKWTGETLI